MKKDHPLFRNISKQILHYMTDGNITSITEKHTKKPCPSSQSWNKLPKADLRKMRGLVLITVAFAGLGLCVIACEKFVPKYWSKKPREVQPLSDMICSDTAALK